jgi:hypothetical protein
MKKTLLVLAMASVMFMAIPASATHHTLSLNGYCDFFSLNNYAAAPIPKIIVAGYHDLTTNCGYSVSPSVGGFKTGISPYVQYGLNGTTTGAVYNVNDQEAAYDFGFDESLTWLLNVPKFNWVVWGCSDHATLVFINEGTLTEGAIPQVKGARPAALR